MQLKEFRGITSLGAVHCSQIGDTWRLQLADFHKGFGYLRMHVYLLTDECKLTCPPQALQNNTSGRSELLTKIDPIHSIEDVLSALETALQTAEA